MGTLSVTSCSWPSNVLRFTHPNESPSFLYLLLRSAPLISNSFCFTTVVSVPLLNSSVSSFKVIALTFAKVLHWDAVTVKSTVIPAWGTSMLESSPKSQCHCSLWYLTLHTVALIFCRKRFVYIVKFALLTSRFSGKCCIKKLGSEPRDCSLSTLHSHNVPVWVGRLFYASLRFQACYLWDWLKQIGTRHGF